MSRSYMFSCSYRRWTKSARTTLMPWLKPYRYWHLQDNRISNQGFRTVRYGFLHPLYLPVKGFVPRKPWGKCWAPCSSGENTRLIASRRGCPLPKTIGKTGVKRCGTTIRLVKKPSMKASKYKQKITQWINTNESK